MWLSRMTVGGCRCITNAELELVQHANILYGDNASGKSSLLEALSVLSRGRSFRTSRIAELISQGEETLTVSARVEDGLFTGNDYPVGISKTTIATRIRINHADVLQQAELSAHIPLTLIHPGSVELVTGSPALRRAFLDWIAFYLFQDFNLLWKNYQQVLKQRNTCLRDVRQRYALTHWTQQLAGLQPALYRYRKMAMTALQAALNISQALLNAIGEPQLQMTSGFPQGVNVQNADDLKHFYQAKAEAELRQGFTLYGGHRADIHILLDGVPATRIASRGQLKLLAISLLLAQSHAISETEGKRGIIAVDDLVSELDEHNQQSLYAVLHKTQQQLIITGTRPEPLSKGMQDARVFHVEHGNIHLCE